MIEVLIARERRIFTLIAEGRKRVRRLMRRIGLTAVAPAPNTSWRQPGHPVYPYLLRDLTIVPPIRSGAPT